MSRLMGKPTPVSRTVSTQVPGGSWRSVTVTVPGRPPGTAGFSAFDISSFSIMPHGIATFSSSVIASTSSSRVIRTSGGCRS
jgi:hypothetical protein